VAGGVEARRSSGEFPKWRTPQEQIVEVLWNPLVRILGWIDLTQGKQFKIFQSTFRIP